MNSKSGKGIKFFTAVNQAYYNYALALEASLLKNTGERLTIFTINFCANDKPFRIRTDIPIKKEMVGKFTYEAAACMRSRAALFYNMILSLRATGISYMVMWIDADSLVRKPIDGLIEHIQDCRVTAKQKGPNDYASGVMGIGTNALGFSVLYKFLVSNDEHWKSDQRNLVKTIQAFEGCGFKPLPEIYCDTGFTDDGVIWTAKIKCHDDPKWLKEYEYYFPR